jgi:DNA repair exonuclease SbcCD ATPase subunit
LGELNKVSDNAIEKIEEVKNSRSLIDNLNEKISQTNDRYSKLESVIQEIDDKNNSIKEIKDGIATITKDVMAYNKQAEEVKDKLQLVQDKQVVYEKAFKNFADESKLILQSENDIEKVMEKFRQVDSLHADLKKREIQIEGLKSKVNEAITKYEKIDSTVDDKIRLLQTLLTTAEESPMMKNITKDEDSLRETVVRLSKAGYSTDDIMAQLNLSGGQIEYILESEKRK